MNRRMIAFVLGRILLAEACLMLPSVVVGLLYRESAIRAFLPVIGVLALVGILCSFKKPKDTSIYARDGFFIVAAAWILLSLAGAVPFYLSGRFPSFIDAVFEIVSGFTTTGATVFGDVEALPHCILFWRSFSHWVGGMGVLVFVLAIVPLSEDRSLHLMRAESPGPVVGKLVPKMKDTAKILYGVYTAMTITLVILLVCGGMPLFDALCTAFGTAGTGGFSVKNAGIAFYDSAYIDVVLSVFMLLFGVNFNLYYLLLIGKVKHVLKSEELRWYLLIVLGAVIAIAVNTFRLYQDVFLTLRHSLFQVSTIITTTGFATVDFAQWPQFSQGILLLLMVLGACAGSTGGGLKISRVLLLAKACGQEIRRLLHPRAVTVVRLEGKVIDRSVIQSTLGYLGLYFACICGTTLLLSLDGRDLTTNLSATLACLNNIGPGLGGVGPLSNYSFYSGFSKILLSLNMLLGRLELFPLFVLFSPAAWKRNG